MAGSDDEQANITGREKLRALAEAALTLSDDQTAQRFGTNAREAVQTTYGWHRDAGRLRDVYDTIAGVGA
ncbi:hypothetical protein [Halorubrum sp. DTA46]|uniref:hypothetical protein n=1 Tax=Halorubrum sp. DTA46 TaxID=3402162 RepID=UPI003AAA5B4E